MNRSTIGPYTILHKLGEGRYGISYLAESPQDGVVVVKRFKSRMFWRNQAKNGYEADILSQIDHPAIPKLLSVIHEKNLHAFVLEHKTGATAETLLFRQKARFSESGISSIGMQLINILKYLHGKGIVHRDIRIPNVLLDDGNVSLVDFGLARWVDRKRYTFDQDFSYLADFLLYLHYSTYQKRGKTKPWYEELDLTENQMQFYKKMLGLESPYSSIDEVERDFSAFF